MLAGITISECCQVLGPFLSPVNKQHARKQIMTQLVPYHTHGRLSWLLILTWFRPGYCRYLRDEAGDGIHCLSLSMFFNAYIHMYIYFLNANELLLQAVVKPSGPPTFSAAGRDSSFRDPIPPS